MQKNRIAKLRIKPNIDSPNSHFRTDASMAIKNSTKRRTADTQCFSGSCYREAERLKTKLFYYFTGKGGLCISIIGITRLK